MMMRGWGMWPSMSDAPWLHAALYYSNIVEIIKDSANNITAWLITRPQ